MLSLPMPLTSSGVVRSSLSSGNVHLLPVELLSEIFLLILRDWPWFKERLVLVCRRWYAIMLLMPGITSRLWIRRATKKEVVQASIDGRRTRFAVIVDVNDKRHGENFDADDFHASFMTAVQAASRWYSLQLSLFPLPGEYNKSHTIVQPLETLLQPGYLHIFGSLTSLTIAVPKKMETPADILPHLQRLERFHAQHLHLPIYQADSPLPLVQTLRDLMLKSVSVQWMAGKAFPVLQRCSITFPHHSGTICVQPVTMPACIFLRYDANDLHPLGYFHDLPLDKLMVTCGQWNIKRGDPQLVSMCPIVFASAQSVTTLHLQVQCSEKLLVLALSPLGALDELVLRLASPHTLSETFFRAFIATRSNADGPCELATPPKPPLCVKLKGLEVHYKRWLRSSERNSLIPVFSDIVSSRWSKGLYIFLCFERPVQSWEVQRPVGSIRDDTGDNISVIGIKGPHGIIPLEWVSPDPLTEVFIKEAEYLVAGDKISTGCLLNLHHLAELRVGNGQEILPTTAPPHLPLFHTLRVFVANNIWPSFLAHQTFHKLERCRISLRGGDSNLRQGQITQMPVCTRLDVDGVTLLATFKLPQIRELGVSLDHPEINMIWENHIAVNANLSGLELLHVYRRHRHLDLIQVLRCLPALKSLIVGNGSDLDVDFFKGFVPMHLNEAAALMQSHDEGRISAILCPMLRSLLIEGCDLRQQLALIPVLKQVVTLRAAYGSPLERFTLFYFEHGRKTELIGSDWSSVVTTVVLDADTEPFKLDI